MPYVNNVCSPSSSSSSTSCLFYVRTKRHSHRERNFIRTIFLPLICRCSLSCCSFRLLRVHHAHYTHINPFAGPTTAATTTKPNKCVQQVNGNKKKIKCKPSKICRKRSKLWSSPLSSVAKKTSMEQKKKNTE